MRAVWIFGAAAAASAAVSFGACGSSTNGGSAGGAGGGGPMGPTDLVVTWSFMEMPASASVCATYNSDRVDITLEGTIDPTLTQTQTARCADGKYTFKGLLVQNIGQSAQVDGAAYNSAEQPGVTNYAAVHPMLGTTTVNIDFFGLPGAATGSGGAPATTTAPASSTSGGGGMGGMGGAGGTSAGGMGGAGGMASGSSTASQASSSSAAATSSSSSSSQASSSSSSTAASTSASTGAGGGDAG